MSGVRLYDDLAMVIKFKPMPWEYDLSLQTGKSAAEENDPKDLDYGYILRIEAVIKVSNGVSTTVQYFLP